MVFDPLPQEERNSSGTGSPGVRERYEALFNRSLFCVYVHDLEGRFLDANDAAVALLGYSREEIPFLNIASLLPEEHLDKALEDMERLARGEASQQLNRYRLLKKDGSRVWVEVEATALFQDGKPYAFQGIARDVTERTTAEKALYESEKKYRDLVENINDVIFSVNEQGIFTFISRRIESVIEYTPGEIVGRPFSDFLHPQDLPVLRQEFRNVLEGRLNTTEYRLITKQKTPVWIRSSSRPVYRGNRITGLRGTMTDISESRLLRDQLLHSQKMQAVGTLAGGIAHDFNNLLAAILGFTELALFGEEEGSTLRKYLEQILRAGNRGKELVKKILVFSRDSEEQRRPIELQALLNEALDFFRAAMPSNIELRLNLPASLLFVLADPSQIQQVVINLCSNAAFAMRDTGGRLEVTLKPAHLDADALLFYADLSPGDYVIITVKDTGCGMSPGIVDRIFEPFFSTKASGEGTGLGLSVAHGIVTNLGGGITVHSEPGLGTTFRVVLPRMEASVTETEGADLTLLPGRGHILFVDDEPALAEWGKELLKTLGYEVTVRTDSREALETFRQSPERVDLVITDLSMPNLPGLDLAAQLMQTRPGLPVILCTGFGEKTIREQAAEMGIREVLTKPVSSVALSESVWNLLAGVESLSK